MPVCCLQVRPVAGSVLLWPNITPGGLLEPRTVHAAEPPTAGASKYGVNVWFRGCAQRWWGELVVTAKQLVPVSWRPMWPSGLAGSWCIYCGRPVGTEISRWNRDNHESHCLFRDALEKLDWNRVKNGEQIVLKAEQKYGSLTRSITYNTGHLRQIADAIKPVDCNKQAQ